MCGSESCQRLQHTVQHLLDATVGGQSQLAEAVHVQREMEERVETQQQEVTALAHTVGELQQQLEQETQGRLLLAEELARAEGMLQLVDLEGVGLL